MIDALHLIGFSLGDVQVLDFDYGPNSFRGAPLIMATGATFSEVSLVGAPEY